MLYAHVLQLTEHSSSLIKEIRMMVTHFNTPLLWLFWGIMGLVYLDIFNNIYGNPLRYGFMISKVMFEAFFYSMFFAMWGDVMNQTNLRQRIAFIKKIRNALKVILLKRNDLSIHISHVLSLHFAINYAIVMYYSSWYFTLFYAFISSFTYRYISKYIYNITIEDNHVYTSSKSSRDEKFDAIIKWEYSKLPNNSQNYNWILI